MISSAGARMVATTLAAPVATATLAVTSEATATHVVALAQATASRMCSASFPDHGVAAALASVPTAMHRDTVGHAIALSELTPGTTPEGRSAAAADPPATAAMTANDATTDATGRERPRDMRLPF